MQTLRRTTLSLAIMAATTGLTAFAAERVEVEFSIDSQLLSKAINQFAEQADTQVFYSQEILRDLKSRRLEGNYTPEQALRALLSNTGLTYEWSDNNTFILRTEESQEAPDGETEKNEVSEEILVTGTLIRNNYPTANVKLLDQEYFDSIGAGSVADVIQSLPENFNGINLNTSALSSIFNNNFQAQSRRATRVNPGQAVSGLGGDGIGTALADLFGLGAGSTLVLINGKRPASSAASEIGGYNLNNMPLAAVERIEILPDGASSSYGADAVGGVINIITKKSYAGAETRVRYDNSSHAADGYTLSQTLGINWESGNALFTLSHREQDPVNLVKAGYTGPDLTPQGGFDWTNDVSTALFNPGALGNIGSFTATGDDYNAFISNWRLADGVDPAAYTPFGYRVFPGETPFVIVDSANSGDFVRDFGDFIGPISAQGSNTKNSSISLSLQQTLAEGTDAYVDISYSKNEATVQALPFVATIVLTPDSPFYLFSAPTDPVTGEPLSVPDVGVRYSFSDETDAGLIAPNFQESQSRNIDFTLGVDQVLPYQDWLMRSYLSYAKNESDLSSTGLSADGLEELANSGEFNPFADFNDMDFASLVSFNDGNQSPVNEQFLFNTTFDGSVMELPGGVLRAAVGFELRLDSTDYSNDSSNHDGDGNAIPPTPISDGTGLLDPNPKREVISAFTELSIPLIGKDNALPGIESLLLSIGVRWEDYSSDDILIADQNGDTSTVDSNFSSTSPSIGLNWAPHADLNVSVRWSQSFQVPSLTQLFGVGSTGQASLNQGNIQDPEFGGADLLDTGTGTVNVISSGNSSLQPESSDNYSASITWNPGALTNFSATLSYNRTKYAERIGNILSEAPLDTGNNDLILLADNSPFPVAVRDPDTNILVAVNNIPVNLGEQISESATLSLDYDFGYGEWGGFRASLAGSHFIRLESQVPGFEASSDNIADKAGTNLGPQDWRVNGQLQWQRDNYGLTLRGDFSSGYEHVNIFFPKGNVAANPEPAPNEHVEHYTFYTLSGFYRMDDQGVNITAGIKNLTNTNLPFFNSSNANFDLKQDINGRMIFMEVRKTFEF